MAHRICFALDLVDDDALIAAYERAHAPGEVWPQVTEAIRRRGFSDMEIWRAGDRLFMIATVSDDWPREVPDELRVVDERWEAAMNAFQRPLPFAAAGEKWVRMTRIYALDEQ